MLMFHTIREISPGVSQNEKKNEVSQNARYAYVDVSLNERCRS